MHKAFSFFTLLWMLAATADAQRLDQAKKSFHQMIEAGIEEVAEERIDAAERDVKAALRAGEAEAECEAMLATVYGFKLNRKAWKGIWLGPKIDKLYRSAMRKDPDNARVFYLAGLGFMHAPDRFRDRDEEEKILLRADELFAAEGDREGRAKTCLKLGDLMIEKKDRKGARRYYLSALELQPDFELVQRRLEAL